MSLGDKGKGATLKNGRQGGPNRLSSVKQTSCFILRPFRSRAGLLPALNREEQGLKNRVSHRLFLTKAVGGSNLQNKGSNMGTSKTVDNFNKRL